MPPVIITKIIPIPAIRYGAVLRNKFIMFLPLANVGLRQVKKINRTTKIMYAVPSL